MPSLLFEPSDRWVSPYINHFIQPDTIVSDGVQGYDRYAYVNNNPLRYTDPTGHMRTSEQCGASGDQCDHLGASSGWTGKVIRRTDRTSTHTGLGGNGGCTTVWCQANNGDLTSIKDLIAPTHFGWRSQLEFGATFGAEAGYGITVTGGFNFAWNRKSNEIGMSIDGSFEPIGAGFGPPIGGSVTGGPLIGWGSSTVHDVVNGNSYIASVTASYYPAAGSAAATAPMDKDWKLHVDPTTGVVPATLFGGGGVGSPYASIGGGGSHTFVAITTDLDALFK